MTRWMIVVGVMAGMGCTDIPDGLTLQMDGGSTGATDSGSGVEDAGTDAGVVSRDDPAPADAQNAVDTGSASGCMLGEAQACTAGASAPACCSEGRHCGQAGSRMTCCRDEGGVCSEDYGCCGGMRCSLGACRVVGCDPVSRTDNGCPDASPYCGFGSLRGVKVNICIPHTATPSRIVGESCQLPSQCARGLSCPTTSGRCQQLCRMGTAICASGRACEESGYPDNIGLCPL